MKICNTDEQYSCYKTDYYIIYLGMYKNNYFVDFSNFTMYFKKMLKFIRKELSLVDINYSLFKPETFDEFLDLLLSTAKCYYITDTLDLGIYSENNVRTLKMDYRMKPIDVSKKEIKSWLVKNTMLSYNKGTYVSLEELKANPQNLEIIEQYKWTKEELLSAQKYYMKDIFSIFMARNTTVSMYKDSSYLYYTVCGNCSFDKISIETDKLTKIRLFLHTVDSLNSVEMMHNGFQPFDINGKVKIKSYEDL